MHRRISHRTRFNIFQMRWISVNDRLPDTTRWVLCRNGDKGVPFVGCFTYGNQIECDIDDPADYLDFGWWELEQQIDSGYDEHWFKRSVTVWQELPA